MKASEIFGQEIKQYLARVNVAKIDDYDLSRMIVVIAQDIEDREQRSRQDLLQLMYGDHEGDKLRSLDTARVKAEIEKIDAQAAQIRRSPLE